MNDSQNKKFSKLITHVAYFIKVIGNLYVSLNVDFQGGKLRIDYHPDLLYANIYVPTDSYYVGTINSYSHTLIDALVELSDKHGISYRIGKDEVGTMYIQIYV